MGRLPRILAILVSVYLLSFLGHARSHFEHITKTYPIHLASSSESFANIFRENIDIGAKLKKAIPKLLEKMKSIFSQKEVNEIFEGYNSDPKYARFMRDVNAIYKILERFPGKDVSETDVFLINIYYEFDAGCTAVMAVQEPGGYVRLAHNLDFPNYEFFRSVYIATDFIRDGRKDFSCSGPVGGVGVMLCTKIGKYSIALNERDKDKDLKRMGRRAKEAKWPIMWLIREVLEKCQTYEEAVTMLNETETVSGSYLSIAGAKVGLDDKTYKYQGIILTKTHDATIHEEYLNSTNNFLAQGNTDWNDTNKKVLNDPTWRTRDGFLALRDIARYMPGTKFTSQQLRDNVLKSYPNLRFDDDPLVPKHNDGTISIVSMEPNGTAPIESWVYWQENNTCLGTGSCEEHDEKKGNPFCCCSADSQTCSCCKNILLFRCYNIVGHECKNINLPFGKELEEYAGYHIHGRAPAGKADANAEDPEDPEDPEE